MAQCKVKGSGIYSTHHEIVAKVCMTMEQRIGSNISITSPYIPFLDNTHLHSLKYHALAKDSPNLHSRPQLSPKFQTPLSSHNLLFPWYLHLHISHTSASNSWFPIYTPSLTSAVVSLSTLLLKQEAEDNLAPIFLPCHLPTTFNPLTWCCLKMCLSLIKTLSISHLDDHHNFITALPTLPWPPSVFSQQSNRVIPFSCRSDPVTLPLLTSYGSHLGEK